MSRSNRRTLRHEGRGIRWTIEPVGGSLQIEIVFDDEPDKPIRRTRYGEAMEAVIAEQLKDGFVPVPRRQPSVEWVRTAPSHELGVEVLDAWIMAAFRGPEVFATLPATVRAFVALNALATQSSRNGLASFVVEIDPQVVAHTGDAARLVGLPNVATLFERATGDIDFKSVFGMIPTRLKWASPAAAKKLQAHACLELDERLEAFVRAHAEDFLPLPIV